MGLLTRRRPPAAARPALERDERIVAWALVADDPAAAVVVTTLGLWLPGRARLGWHQIHKATWSGSVLTVTPATLVDARDSYDVMADDSPVPVALAAAGDVPGEVRDRVNRSVGHTSHHPVPGGGVRVVARREPGVNGVRWHVRYDDGTAADDPEVVALTHEIVAAAAAPTPE